MSGTVPSSLRLLINSFCKTILQSGNYYYLQYTDEAFGNFLGVTHVISSFARIYVAPYTLTVRFYHLNCLHLVLLSKVMLNYYFSRRGDTKPLLISQFTSFIIFITMWSYLFPLCLLTIIPFSLIDYKLQESKDLMRHVHQWLIILKPCPARAELSLHTSICWMNSLQLILLVWVGIQVMSFIDKMN